MNPSQNLTDPNINRSEHIEENINAKRTANYQYDGANWQREPYAGAPLSTEIDQEGTLTYIGEAQPGAATSESVWRISQIDTSANPITILWAGSGLFNQIFDDRSSLEYA